MKTYEMLLAGFALLGGFAAANYRLGHCYWRHKTTVKWLLSLISAAIIMMSILQPLLVYYPDLRLRLYSRFYAVIALLVLVGLSTIYRRLFSLGDRTAPFIPNPNQTYEDSDLPEWPEPAK